MKCRHGNDSDLDMICEILAEGFYNDPVHSFVFSHREERLAALNSLFRIYVNLSMQYGGTLIAGNNAGVLVYYRPEIMKMTDKEKIAVDEQVRQVCGADYEIAAAYLNGLENYHPQTPLHYYITLLAVQSTHRGGKAVSDLFCDLNNILDRENIPCYAECTRWSTRTLLRRWNYRDCGAPLNIDIEGFPALYPVWREPGKMKGRISVV